jgi:DNA-binding beta-propeller fold protein YncE
VFDAARHTVVDTLALDSSEASPRSFAAMALSPDGARLYLPDPTGTILVVNTATHALLDPIADDPEPQEIVLSPDGRSAYVTHRHSEREDGLGTLSGIDLNTGKVVARTLDRAPGRIALAADGGRLLIANPQACSVSVVDFVFGLTVYTIPLEEGPRAVALAARPSMPTATAVPTRSPTPSAPPDMTRACAYVSDLSNHVSIIDVASQSVIGAVSGIEQPTRLAVAPDGTNVYTTGTANGGATGVVTVINTRTSSVSGTVIVGGIPFPISLNGDGTRAYVGPFDSACYSLVGIDTLTGALDQRLPCDSCVQPTDASPRIVDLAVAPDSARAYVQRYAGPEGSLSAIDPTSGSTVHTVPFSQTPGRLAISPDGRVLYSALRGGGTATLAVVDALAGRITDAIVLGSDDGSAAAWAVASRPDGRMVYVGHYELNQTVNHVAVIDTTNKALVTDIPIDAPAEAIAFTPDSAFAYVVIGSTVVIIDTTTATAVKTLSLPGTGQDVAIGAIPFGCVVPRESGCVGDCASSGAVEISDVLLGVNIALGRASVEQCMAIDANGDGSVTIDELLKAITNALNGCPRA